jgi:hypothetical protein
MKALSNSELLELTDDFISEWHFNLSQQSIAFRGLIHSQKDDVYWQKRTGNIYVNELGGIMGCDTFQDAPKETHDDSIYATLTDTSLVYCGDWTKFEPEAVRVKARALWAESRKKLLDHPFRHLVLTEPKDHLDRVLNYLNSTGGTSTEFMYYLSDVGGQESIESLAERFELAVVMVFAAAIHIVGDPENYSNDAVDANVMREIPPSKHVIKHAAGLRDALVEQGYSATPIDLFAQRDIDVSRFMREVTALANGGSLRKELERFGRRSQWVVREITAISRYLFDIKTNRGKTQRFSTHAIKRIFDFLYDMDVMGEDEQIGVRQISKIQRSFDHSHIVPLSFNQDDLPF